MTWWHETVTVGGMQADITLGPTGRDTRNRIILDGEDITRDVQAIEVRASVGEPTTITLTLNVDDSVTHVRIFESEAQL